MNKIKNWIENQPADRVMEYGKVIGIAFILFFIIVTLLYVQYKQNYIINTTKSIPIGLYSIDHDKEKLATGDTIAFCLNPKFIEFAQSQDLVRETKGGWCNGIQPILKTIVAVENDVVVFSQDGISVNGQLIEGTKPITEEYVEYKTTLKPDELVVATNEKLGFDSRYFKEINKNEVISKITPVYTF